MTKRDWQGWNFGTPKLSRSDVRAFQAFGRRCADMALDGLSFWIPAVWGTIDKRHGPMPRNALTVFADNTDSVGKPVLKIDVAAMLREDIAACRLDGSFADGLLRIADEMDALSASIRRAAALKKNDQPRAQTNDEAKT